MLAESVKHLNNKAQQWRSGKQNWGKAGVLISLMGKLPTTLYSGEIYGSKTTAIVSTTGNTTHVKALWAFSHSGELEHAIRKTDCKAIC